MKGKYHHHIAIPGDQLTADEFKEFQRVMKLEGRFLGAGVALLIQKYLGECRGVELEIVNR